MRATNLNLTDRRSWLKFQHILTSFVSDYFDLVAPEQTELKLQAQTLTIAFTFLADTVDQDCANRFTQQLERWLLRLQLAGVRRIELQFFLADGDLPVLERGLEIHYIAPSALQTADNSAVTQSPRRSGGLVRRIRNWLLSPENIENLQTSSRLAVRDPKGFLASAGATVRTNFVKAIDWIDTYPWEEKFQSTVQAQKRRHQRNLWKALFEDALILLVIVVAALWIANHFAGPTLDISAMPAQHYDNSMTSPRYRCSSPGIKLENYICLQKGMSYEQVSSILGSEGKPLGIDYQFGGSLNQSQEIREKLARGESVNWKEQPVIISWQNNEMVLNATFRNNELVARGYRKLS